MNTPTSPTLSAAELRLLLEALITVATVGSMRNPELITSRHYNGKKRCVEGKGGENKFYGVCFCAWIISV